MSFSFIHSHSLSFLSFGFLLSLPVVSSLSLSPSLSLPSPPCSRSLLASLCFLLRLNPDWSHICLKLRYPPQLSSPHSPQLASNLKVSSLMPCRQPSCIFWPPTFGSLSIRLWMWDLGWISMCCICGCGWWCYGCGVNFGLWIVVVVWFDGGFGNGGVICWVFMWCLMRWF